MNTSISRMEVTEAEATGLGRALEPLQTLGARLRIDLSFAREAIDVPLETAICENRRIPWTDFIWVIAEFGRKLEPYGGWTRIEDLFANTTISKLGRILGLFLSPAMTSRAAWTWIAPHWFPHLVSTYEEVSGVEFHLTLEIPAPHAFDPGYFEITRCMLRELPAYSGLPLADVRLKVDGRFASFTVRCKRSRTLLGRFKRWFSEQFLADHLEELITRERSLLMDGFSTLASEKQRLAETVSARTRVIETIRAAVFEIRFASGRRTVSSDFFRLFGTTSGDPRTVEEIVVESAIDEHREMVLLNFSALQSGRKERSEFEFCSRRDDVEHWIRVRMSRTDLGEPRMAASFFDVTETHVAFAEAEQTLARLERVLEVVPFAVIVHRGGKRVFRNAAYDRLPSKTGDAILGHRALDLEGEPQLVTVVADQGDRDVQLRVQSAIIDWEGVSCTLTTIEDVTVSQAIVERSMVIDRMAATGTHAAGIAHEINNPLAYIQSNLDYSTEILEEVATRDHNVEEIIDALTDAKLGTVRVREVVAALKDFSRHATGELAPTDLPDVIHRAINIVWSEIRDRAELVTAYDISRPVLADSVNLIQVLVAILRNAAAAIPEGQRGRIDVRVRTQVGEAVIEIVDDGEGIGPDVLPRVFDPFFTTRAPGVGAGLGLSLARSRVERMNGHLRLLSSTEAGTVAELHLPLAGPLPAPRDLDDKPS